MVSDRNRKNTSQITSCSMQSSVNFLTTLTRSWTTTTFRRIVIPTSMTCGLSCSANARQTLTTSSWRTLIHRQSKRLRMSWKIVTDLTQLPKMRRWNLSWLENCSQSSPRKRLATFLRQTMSIWGQTWTRRSCVLSASASRSTNHLMLASIDRMWLVMTGATVRHQCCPMTS